MVKLGKKTTIPEKEKKYMIFERKMRKEGFVPFTKTPSETAKERILRGQHERGYNVRTTKFDGDFHIFRKKKR